MDTVNKVAAACMITVAAAYLYATHKANKTTKEVEKATKMYTELLEKELEITNKRLEKYMDAE
jgi:hypothetical protein